MWPWEHAALGYVLASLAVRLVWLRPPDDTVALAAVFGTQFPDLVDKPLGWVFEVLPSGISLGHSIFTATVLCLAMLTLGFLYDRREAALAFCIGYLSHLPADVLYPTINGGEPTWSILLWPFVVSDSRGAEPAAAFIQSLFENYVGKLVSGQGMSELLILEVVLLLGVLLVWQIDGRPGIPPFGNGPVRSPH